MAIINNPHIESWNSVRVKGSKMNKHIHLHLQLQNSHYFLEFIWEIRTTFWFENGNIKMHKSGWMPQVKGYTLIVGRFSQLINNSIISHWRIFTGQIEMKNNCSWTDVISQGSFCLFFSFATGQMRSRKRQKKNVWIEGVQMLGKWT